MQVERVRILRALKMGPRTYKKGEVLEGRGQITPDLIAEIRGGSTAIEVLGRPSQAEPPAPNKGNAGAHSLRDAHMESENIRLKNELEAAQAKILELEERIEGLAKGLLIAGEEPSVEQDDLGDENAAEGFRCPECDFVAKTKLALASHMRVHKK